MKMKYFIHIIILPFLVPLICHANVEVGTRYSFNGKYYKVIKIRSINYVYGCNEPGYEIGWWTASNYLQLSEHVHLGCKKWGFDTIDHVIVEPAIDSCGKEHELLMSECLDMGETIFDWSDETCTRSGSGLTCGFCPGGYIVPLGGYTP